MKQAGRFAQWAALPAALFALVCALLTPVEAGSADPHASEHQTAAQEPEQREPEPLSAVRGRVVYDDTGRPVRRARLILMGESGDGGEHSALTDGRGEFRVEGVRAGSYYAYVDVPGLLSPFGFMDGEEAGVGLPDLGEGRKFFDLVEVDGKGEVSLTVRARRGASLSGRVTYADGDPAVNANLSIMRRGADGKLTKFLAGVNLATVAGMKTDDRGMFRAVGLPPGEYVLGVSETTEHGGPGGRTRTDDMPALLETLVGKHFLTTYHPSATSVKEAAVLKLAAGEERAGVDVVIPDRELRTVAGVVRSRRDRSPVAGARVFIVRRDDPDAESETHDLYTLAGSAPNAVTADDEGRWRFREIPDGPYTVTVRSPEPLDETTYGELTANLNANLQAADPDAPSGNLRRDRDRERPRREGTFAPARRDLDVSGDVSELTIEVSEGGRVSGTLAVEGGKPSGHEMVSLLRVSEDRPVPGPGDSYSAHIKGGRFSAEGLPAGKFFLRVGFYSGEAKLYVKSITWQGRDLLGEPLELEEGERVTGVRIVFGRDPATLRLRGVAANGKPARYAVFVLVPPDPSAWHLYANENLICSSGEDGSCTMAVPPGEYRLVTLLRTVGPEAVSEVRRRAAAAPRLSLRAGEAREFEATLTER